MNDENKYFTVLEASEKLGMGVMTVYRLLNDKKLKAYRFRERGDYRIKADDLDDYIDSRAV